MQKTMKIDGMMCPHCEARVKKTLEKLEQVSQAQVSWQDGTATVTLCADLPDEVLRQVIEEQDYTVLSVE